MVPGSGNRVIKSAVEDVRPAIVDNPLSVKIQEAIDNLTVSVEHSIDDAVSSSAESSHEQATSSNSPTEIFDENMCLASENPSLPQIGQDVEVYWPLDQKFYPGVIDSIDPKTQEHHITYEDGDIEKLSMQDETWRYKDTGTHVRSDKTHFDLPVYPLRNAYDSEEAKFKETV